jgi:hypothetical protein
MGEGGILDLKDRGSNRNKFAEWKDLTPLQNELIDTIIGCDSHVIATMRAKTEYVLDERNKPTKVGTAPIQRNGVEFEFDVVGELSSAGDYNTIDFTKTRCPQLRGRSFRNPGEEVAQILYDWTQTATAPAAKPAAAAATPQVTEAQERFFDRMRFAVDEAKLFEDRAAAAAWVANIFGDVKMRDLTDEQCNDAYRQLEEDLDAHMETQGEVDGAATVAAEQNGAHG